MDIHFDIQMDILLDDLLDIKKDIHVDICFHNKLISASVWICAEINGYYEELWIYIYIYGYTSG
jgi:hypothetical protein